MPQPPVSIVRLTHEHSRASRQLLKKGFPWQRFLPLGDLSLLLYFFKETFLSKMVLHCLGIDQTLFWIAISNQSHQVVGIIGLYSKRVDSEQSYWLDWFCVAPEFRGQSIGSYLLEFSIEQCHQSKKHFLRVITSDDPNEGVAQALYERYGFYKIQKSEPWYWQLFNTRLICKELGL